MSKTQGADLSDRWVGRITVGTTVAALGMSYRNQVDFATQHGGYPLWLAWAWPLVIDSFVVMGELRLFSAALRRERGFHGWLIKAWGWALTLGGLAASMAVSIAHVGLDAPAGMKLAAAAAPLAAAASLGTGLGIVKLRTRSAGAEGDMAGTSGTPAAVNAGVGRAAHRGSPAARRSRARSRTDSRPTPAADVVAQWIADDQLAGLDMSRRKFAGRHNISEHQARSALVSVHNGGHQP